MNIVTDSWSRRAGSAVAFGLMVPAALLPSNTRKAVTPGARGLPADGVGAIVGSCRSIAEPKQCEQRNAKKRT